MEGTIWKELTSRNSIRAEDSASSGGQSAVGFGSEFRTEPKIGQTPP